MLYYRLIAALAFTSFSLVVAAQQPVLLKAHSHNDYKHKRPLLDALENGFFSVEADVFYENGSFIVAHTKAGTREKNTLEKLYLMPLRDRVNSNNGKVYVNGPLEFEMMIDLKGDWDKSRLDSLSRLVEKYSELFTVFIDGVKTVKAVRIVLSGNGTKYSAAEQNPRYFSIDGGFGDFDSKLDPAVICRTSASFRSEFKWRGRGKITDDERKKLHQYVMQAHASGRKIRFWAATNKETVWKELLDAGVDWINVDKLKKFRRFYSGQSNPSGIPSS